MSTTNARGSKALVLPAGYVLTVATGVASTASIVRVADTPGSGDPSSPVPLGAQDSLAFGPFAVLTRWVLYCLTGSITDVVAPGFEAPSAAAALDVAQTFTKAQTVAPVALTPGTTVTPDSSASNNFSLTPAQNFTLANATHPAAARALNIEIIQDGTGSRVLTLGSEYKFPSGADKVLSTAAGAVDYLSCVRNAANTAWICSLAKDSS